MSGKSVGSIHRARVDDDSTSIFQVAFCNELHFGPKLLHLLITDLAVCSETVPKVYFDLSLYCLPSMHP